MPYHLAMAPDMRFADAEASANPFVGAAYEARTRYLHLGKVALYRMSYARIVTRRGFGGWCLRSELNQRHADFQSAALPTELQRHIMSGGNNWTRTSDPLLVRQVL